MSKPSNPNNRNNRNNPNSVHLDELNKLDELKGSQSAFFSVQSLKQMLSGVPPEVTQLVLLATGVVSVVVVATGRGNVLATKNYIQVTETRVNDKITTQSAIEVQRNKENVTAMVTDLKTTLVLRMEETKKEITSRVDEQIANLTEATLEISQNAIKNQISGLKEAEKQHNTSMSILVPMLQDVIITKDMVSFLLSILNNRGFAGDASESVQLLIDECNNAETTVRRTIGPGIPNGTSVHMQPVYSAMLDRLSSSRFETLEADILEQNRVVVAGIHRRNGATTDELLEDAEQANLAEFAILRAAAKEQYYTADEISEQSFFVTTVDDQAPLDFVQPKFFPWNKQNQMARKIKRLTNNNDSSFVVRRCLVPTRIHVPNMGEAIRNSKSNVWGIFKSDSQLLSRPVFLLTKPKNASKYSLLTVPATTSFEISPVGQL
jgi:hypothetical protein